MEKSNQSLVLGIVIGAVVILAGGFFVYFGSGCADGDCLGLVRKAKIKAPTVTNQPVSATNLPAPVNEAVNQPAKEMGEQPVERRQFTSKSEATMFLLETNLPEKFPVTYIKTSGVSAADASIQNGRVWGVAIENLRGDTESFTVGFESIEIENNSGNDWNDVTVEVKADVSELLGKEKELTVKVKKDNNFVITEQLHISASGNDYSVTTPLFTMEDGHTYQVIGDFHLTPSGVLNQVESITGQITDIEWNI